MERRQEEAWQGRGGVPNRRPPLATPGDEDVYYDNHREQDDERKPLTPRDSLTPAELLEMRTASSYLAYFRSPTTKTSQTPQHAVSAERRLKTPPAWSNVASRRVPTPYVREEDSEDDEDSSQASTSTPGDSYVPTRYTTSTTPQSQHTPFNVPRTRMSLGAESRRSVASVGSSEGDARSVASSNLFGESFVSLDSESPRNRRITIDTGLSHVMGGPYPSTELEDGEKAKRLQLKMVRSYHNFMHNLQSWSEVVRQHWSARHQTALPLSPRSKNLADIHFLENQHRLKMKDLVVDDSEQGFDFCLILQPQEVYSYWADLLDFRTELLGQEMTQAVEDHWEMSMREKKTKGGFGTDDKENDIEGGNASVSTSGKKHGEETPPSASSSMDESEARDFATAMRTPRPPLSSRLSHLVSKRWLSTPEQTAASPSMYSFSDSTSRFSAAPSTVRQPSMFERALGPLASEELADTELTDMNTTVAATPGSIAVSSMTNPHTAVRRKWGNQATQQALQRSSMMSPPVHSLTPAVRRRPLVNRLPPIVPESELSSPSEREEPKEKNPHEIAMEDIPNRKIPRGIAVRTRGLSAFLPAVRRGIVMRKHRPCQEPSFCKIVSTDGGDTIQVHSLTPRQAYPLLREQRRLYNPSEEKALAAADWSLEPEEDQNAAPADRHLAVRHFTRVVRRGTFRTADVVAVHPARREDPRSVAGDKGSLTLRRSQSDYDSNRTFSLVLRSNPAFVRSNGPSDIEEYEIRWATGEGTESQFRYFDFEAATEGEYWLVSRGFLLLQRDAAVGRFAEHRSAGISSHYCRLMGELKQQVAQEFQVHEDDFHEPVTVSFLERRIVEWRGLDMGYMKGFTAPGALPPPSDYFLGFKAPGTAIWSRLRNAGLDVQRVYSLDRRKVILKISCPSYRLMDVAEVLRVKLKTWDGSFASFRQDLIDLYQPLNDPLEGGDTSAGSFDYVFASSVRQQIIDFIIRSRIRDSGAEIGQATVKRPSGLDALGKMIQARVPLHMHGKLEAVFHAWAFYWRLENWTENRDGKSMSHLGIMLDKQEKEMLQGDLPLASSTSDSSDAESLEAAAADSSPQHSRSSSRSGWSKALSPPFWRRFFVGAFFQPLDSIEDYFGEKVAFYFAWLQHTATHLVFLSIAGLILFCCQISSGNFDHPLRPVFALMVMLWTFVVLVNWKKRANFLAYRWGTMSYKEQETTRPQYRGDFEEDEITGEDVVRYPKWKRWTKYAISFPVTLLFTGGTLIMILWVHANRDLQLARYLEQKRNPDAPDFKLQFDFRAIGGGIKATNIELTRENLLDPTFWFITIGMPAMLGLCLPLLNFMLSKLSILLNDFENYRTESEYRTHLIIKVFSFRFVCYFATLYYYAFVSTGSDQAIANGILRVASGVLVYTTVAHWWQVFLQIYAPILIQKVRLHYRTKHLCKELRNVELEEEALAQLETTTLTEDVKKRHVRVFNKRLLLQQAQDDIWMELLLPEHDSFAEYIQAVVQFTFITCFSVVLPITPLICLLNYLLSMRLDAYKLCKGRRRPLAEKTGGIGVWEHLLHIVAVISVLTNCWLIVYTNSEFIWLGEKIGQVGLFVTSEHVMLLVGYTMLTSISKMPKSVRDAMKREKHQLDEQRNASMRSRQNHRSKYHREETENLIPKQPLSPVVMASFSTESPKNKMEKSGDRILWSA